MRFAVHSLVAVFLLTAACADDSGRRPGTRDSSVTPPTDGATGREDLPAFCQDGIDNDGDGLGDCDDPDCGFLVECGGMPPDGGTCEAISREAMTALQPVDIVWVVDNSGSMSEEADLIQTNINNFAAAFAGIGVDVHVVLITSSGFVEVPAPLGTDPSRFLRVPQDVQSSNSLERLVSLYPMYSSFLRRSAVMHFVSVTDDESDLGATSFMSMMMGLLGKNFRFHSIVSPPGSTHSLGGIGFSMDGCAGPHGEAADNGDVYWDLSGSTGGRQFSICSEDWSALFTDLATTVAIPMALPCVYDIPPAPDGMDFDPMRVNVVHTPTGGAPTTIPFVGGFGGCTGEGWYYEGDPASPERILVCPNTCRVFEDDISGRVDIQFGCATILI